MHAYTIELVGSSPLWLQPAENVEEVKQQIIDQFRNSFYNVAKLKSIDTPIEIDINMDIFLENSAQKVERRMGFKRFDHWKIILNISCDKQSLSKDKLFDIIKLVTKKKPGHQGE